MELSVVGIVFGLIVSVIKAYLDRQSAYEATQKVVEVENKLFKMPEELAVLQAQDLSKSPQEIQEILKQYTEKVNRSIGDSKKVLDVNFLSELYTKQIEKYQVETRARAGWSFIAAIGAMVSGLAFVMWGATILVNSLDWKHVAIGSIISTIGATLSAYITKTFLEVHKLSLTQMNHYFQQPVINSQILTAQRLAEQIQDGEARKIIYQNTANAVIKLISNDPQDQHLDRSKQEKPTKPKREERNTTITKLAPTKTTKNK